jgi:hypothetical protein
VTLAVVRDAALDRALVGDDPETALALAGATDSAIRRATGPRPRTGDVTRGDPDARSVGDATGEEPFAAVLLAVGCLGAGSQRPLDDRAWTPGNETDPFVLAGAAAAVRSRDVSVQRAARLANCATTTLDAVVASQRREKEE